MDIAKSIKSIEKRYGLNNIGGGVWRKYKKRNNKNIKPDSRG